MSPISSDTLQIAETIWIDREGPSEQRQEELTLLANVARYWMEVYAWSRRPKQRAAYSQFEPEFLADIDRHYALCERIVEVCNAQTD